MSLINYHCIFIFSADRVGTFKRINVELQTFKLSKNGSNWKVCFSFTKFKWYPMTFQLELLRWSIKIGQLSQPWLRYPFCKTINIFCMFTFQTFLVGSYQRLVTFISRSKGKKQAPLSLSETNPPRQICYQTIIQKLLKDRGYVN